MKNMKDCEINDNCYAYATKKYGSGNLQPGGNIYDRNNITQDGLVKNIIKDGHIRCTYDEKCEPDEHKIMAFISKGIDYHFYRQDKNNKWSHKFAMYPVSTWDGLGNIIENPMYVLRTNESCIVYNTYCGCFRVKSILDNM